MPYAPDAVHVSIQDTFWHVENRYSQTRGGANTITNTDTLPWQRSSSVDRLVFVTLVEDFLVLLSTQNL